MAKVLGLGGVFFKAEDPAAVGAWYARVLGFEVSDWGGVAFKPTRVAGTNWSPHRPDGRCSNAPCRCGPMPSRRCAQRWAAS